MCECVYTCMHICLSLPIHTVAVGYAFPVLSAHTPQSSSQPVKTSTYLFIMRLLTQEIYIFLLLPLKKYSELHSMLWNSIQIHWQIGTLEKICIYIYFNYYLFFSLLQCGSIIITLFYSGHFAKKSRSSGNVFGRSIIIQHNILIYCCLLILVNEAYSLTRKCQTATACWNGCWPRL